MGRQVRHPSTSVLADNRPAHADNQLLVHFEAWIATMAAHVAKGCCVVRAIGGFLRHSARGACRGSWHMLNRTLASVTGFKGFLLKTNSRVSRFALGRFQVALEQIIDCLEHLLGTLDPFNWIPFSSWRFLARITPAETLPIPNAPIVLPL